MAGYLLPSYQQGIRFSAIPQFHKHETTETGTQTEDRNLGLVLCPQSHRPKNESKYNIGAQGAQGPVRGDWPLNFRVDAGMHLCPGGECEMRHGQKVPEPRAQSPSARTGTAAPLSPLRSQPLLLPARFLPFQASALDLLSELVFLSAAPDFFRRGSLTQLMATPLTWCPVLPLPLEPSLLLHGTQHSRDTDWPAKLNTAAESRSVTSLST